MRSASDALVLATSAIALFAGVSLLSSHKSTAESFLNSLKKVEIQIPNLTWIERVQLTAQKNMVAPAAPIKEISFSSYLPKPPKIFARKKSIKKTEVASVEIRELKEQVDKLSWSYAAPIEAAVPFDLPPADGIQAGDEEAPPQEASYEELKRFKELHKTLRTRFELAVLMIADPVDGVPQAVALNTQAPEKTKRIKRTVRPKRAVVITHSKPKAVAQPEVTVAVNTQPPESLKRPMPAEKKAEDAVKADHLAVLAVPLGVKSGPPPGAPPAKLVPPLEKMEKEKPITVSQAAPETPQEAAGENQTQPPLDTAPVYPMLADSSDLSNVNTQVDSQNEQSVEPPPTAQKPAPLTIRIAKNTPVSSSPVVTQSSKVSHEVSKMTFGPEPLPQGAGTPGANEYKEEKKKDSGLVVAGFMGEPIEGDAVAVNPNARVVMAANPQELADAAVAIQQVRIPPKADHVEAFEWFTPVYGVTTERISHQSDPDSKVERGWLAAKAKGYWPTYFWSASANLKTNQPVLSQTAAKLLGSLSQVGVQAEAGIVFGKIAAGWGVELSGRSEAPIFLTAKNEQLSQDDRRQDRYFAFLNVEPGAHLVYLTSGKTTEDFAVVAPVWGGGATHLDLERVRVVNISGRVMDTAGEELVPLKGAEVRIIGQTKGKLSGRNGEFSFGGVWTVGDYPVITEMRYGKEYIHRFNLPVEKLKSAVLYRVPAKQVDDWVQELEGGVSVEGGMILAAVPRLVSENEEMGLYPSLQVTSERQSLAHETYTLSEAGHLMVHRPLDEKVFRYLSVQVPQGPVVTQVQEKTGKTLLSEVVFAQPGILNVVGPY